jgi:predicted TIM-barrel fold metal-dependent hydrolase
MIIDCHTHIFPQAIRDQRDAYFPGEPAFELLYRSPKARLIGVDDLVARMDTDGVDRAVVFGFPWQHMDTTRRNNDYVLEAVSRYPDRLTGFCCLDPASSEAEAETVRCLEAGLGGVGELAFYQSGIDEAALDQLEPVMAVCRRFDVPVMIHTNEPVGHLYPGKTPNTLRQLYRMVKRFDANRLILAHWGGGLLFYLLLKKEVSDVLAHVAFDTAASPFLYRPDMYRLACEIAGPEKILLGSDYPLLPAERYFRDMDAAGLDPAARQAVCGDNAARVLKLPESKAES